MTELDLTALRAKAKNAGERGFCVVLRPDELNALLDRVEKADNDLRELSELAVNSDTLKSAEIARLRASIEKVKSCHEDTADRLHTKVLAHDRALDEIARLRALLARAGEALRPLVARAEKWGSNGDAARVSIRLGDLRTARTIAREIEEAIGHDH